MKSTELNTFKNHTQIYSLLSSLLPKFKESFKNKANLMNSEVEKVIFID